MTGNVVLGCVEVVLNLLESFAEVVHLADWVVVSFLSLAVDDVNDVLVARHDFGWVDGVVFVNVGVENVLKVLLRGVHTRLEAFLVVFS